MKLQLTTLASLLTALFVSGLGATAQAQSACLFEHINFQGQPLCLRAGQRYDNLNGFFNDRASSISVDQGLEVTVCSDAHFRGACRTYFGHISNLVQDGFNDVISSFVVDFSRHTPPPPPTGNPVRMSAQVDVGCKGRVETVSLENFTLAQDNGRFLTFRAGVSMPHKCGQMSYIGAESTIIIPRHQARVGVGGILLAPVVNAQIYCDGRTGWRNAPCISYQLHQ